MRKIILVLSPVLGLLVGCNEGGGTASAGSTQYAYITNNASNSYTQCAVNSDGNLKGCKTTTPSGAAALNQPNGVFFHGNYAYIVNYALGGSGSSANGSYTKCDLNATNGNLSNCNTITPLGITLEGPTSILFNGKYAYISEFNYYGYTQCTVNNTNGNLENCTKIANNAFNSSTGFTLNNNYVYSTNGDGYNYVKCSIDNNSGNLTNCNIITPSAPGALNNPYHVSFSGSYAYIANLAGPNPLSPGNSYTQCSVASNTGDLSNCNTIIPTGSSQLDEPMGVFINGAYAYIPNGGSSSTQNNYVQCHLNSNNGNLENCQTITPKDSKGNNLLSNPSFITFN